VIAVFVICKAAARLLKESWCIVVAHPSFNGYNQFPAPTFGLGRFVDKTRHYTILAES
jgi:hypothetical protein